MAIIFIATCARLPILAGVLCAFLFLFDFIEQVVNTFELLLYPWRPGILRLINLFQSDLSHGT
jgi:hypothetical protein